MTTRRLFISNQYSFIQLINYKMTNNKYSVILPTYNEKRNLPILIYLLNKTFTANKLDWEVIIVDDNSPDGTQEVAKN